MKIFILLFYFFIHLNKLNLNKYSISFILQFEIIIYKLQFKSTFLNLNYKNMLKEKCCREINDSLQKMFARSILKQFAQNLNVDIDNGGGGSKQMHTKE